MSVGVSVLLGMDAEGSVPFIGLGVDGRVVLLMGLGTLGFGDAGVLRFWGGDVWGAGRCTLYNSLWYVSLV